MFHTEAAATGPNRYLRVFCRPEELTSNVPAVAPAVNQSHRAEIEAYHTKPRTGTSVSHKSSAVTFPSRLIGPGDNPKYSIQCSSKQEPYDGTHETITDPGRQGF